MDAQLAAEIENLRVQIARLEHLGMDAVNLHVQLRNLLIRAGVPMDTLHDLTGYAGDAPTPYAFTPGTDPTTHQFLKSFAKDPYRDEAHAAFADHLQEQDESSPLPHLIRHFALGRGAENNWREWAERRPAYRPGVSDEYHHLIGEHGPFMLHFDPEDGAGSHVTHRLWAVPNRNHSAGFGYNFELQGDEARRFATALGGDEGALMHTILDDAPEASPHTENQTPVDFGPGPQQYAAGPTDYDDADDARAFGHHLAANPRDDATRGAFADWLRDRDRHAEADHVLYRPSHVTVDAQGAVSVAGTPVAQRQRRGFGNVGVGPNPPPAEWELQRDRRQEIRGRHRDASGNPVAWWGWSSLDVPDSPSAETIVPDDFVPPPPRERGPRPAGYSAGADYDCGPPGADPCVAIRSLIDRIRKLGGRTDYAAGAEDEAGMVAHVARNPHDQAARNALADLLMERHGPDHPDVPWLADARYPVGFDRGHFGPGHAYQLSPIAHDYLLTAVPHHALDNGPLAAVTHPNTVAQVEREVGDFLHRAGPGAVNPDQDTLAAYHFFHSRNGNHVNGFRGAHGFYDNPDALADLAESYPPHTFHVGDDGKVHGHVHAFDGPEADQYAAPAPTMYVDHTEADWWRALAENPGDRNTLAVFADWAQENNHPLAELLGHLRDHGVNRTSDLRRQFGERHQWFHTPHPDPTNREVRPSYNKRSEGWPGHALREPTNNEWGMHLHIIPLHEDANTHDVELSTNAPDKAVHWNYWFGRIPAELGHATAAALAHADPAAEPFRRHLEKAQADRDLAMNDLPEVAPPDGPANYADDPGFTGLPAARSRFNFDPDTDPGIVADRHQDEGWDAHAALIRLVGGLMPTWGDLHAEWPNDDDRSPVAHMGAAVLQAQAGDFHNALSSAQEAHRRAENHGLGHMTGPLLQQLTNARFWDMNHTPQEGTDTPANYATADEILGPLQDNPDDHNQRLVAADWMAEQGRTREEADLRNLGRPAHARGGVVYPFDPAERAAAPLRRGFGMGSFPADLPAARVGSQRARRFFERMRYPGAPLFRMPGNVPPPEPLAGGGIPYPPVLPQPRERGPRPDGYAQDDPSVDYRYPTDGYGNPVGVMDAIPRKRFLTGRWGNGGHYAAGGHPTRYGGLADTRPFAQEANAAWDASNTENVPGDLQRAYRASHVHGVLADYLGDHADPRRRLVESGHDYHSASTALNARRMGPAYGNYADRWRAGRHAFPDGGELRAWPYSHDNAPCAPTHLHVEWRPEGFTNHYHDVMETGDFHNWVNQFPDDEAARLRASFGIPQPADQYARGGDPTPYSAADDFHAILSQPEHNETRWGTGGDQNLRAVAADAYQDEGDDESAHHLRAGGHVVLTPDRRVKPGRFDDKPTARATAELESHVNNWSGGQFAPDIGWEHVGGHEVDPDMHDHYEPPDYTHYPDNTVRLHQQGFDTPLHVHHSELPGTIADLYDQEVNRADWGWNTTPPDDDDGDAPGIDNGQEWLDQQGAEFDRLLDALRNAPTETVNEHAPPAAPPSPPSPPETPSLFARAGQPTRYAAHDDFLRMFQQPEHAPTRWGDHPDADHNLRAVAADAFQDQGDDESAHHLRSGRHVMVHRGRVVPARFSTGHFMRDHLVPITAFLDEYGEAPPPVFPEDVGGQEIEHEFHEPTYGDDPPPTDKNGEPLTHYPTGTVRIVPEDDGPYPARHMHASEVGRHLAELIGNTNQYHARLPQPEFGDVLYHLWKDPGEVPDDTPPSPPPDRSHGPAHYAKPGRTFRRIPKGGASVPIPKAYRGGQFAPAHYAPPVQPVDESAAAPEGTGDASGGNLLGRHEWQPFADAIAREYAEGAGNVGHPDHDRHEYTRGALADLLAERGDPREPFVRVNALPRERRGQGLVWDEPDGSQALHVVKFPHDQTEVQLTPVVARDPRGKWDWSRPVNVHAWWRGQPYYDGHTHSGVLPPEHVREFADRLDPERGDAVHQFLDRFWPRDQQPEHYADDPSPTQDAAGQPVSPPPGYTLGAGRPSGRKTVHGSPLTAHDVQDASGKVVGDVQLHQTGDDSIAVHWAGARGMAGGEGRGADQPLGPRHVRHLIGQIAAHYPHARTLSYTPAAGRLAAGARRVMDLDAYRGGDQPPPPAQNEYSGARYKPVMYGQLVHPQTYVELIRAFRHALANGDFTAHEAHPMLLADLLQENGDPRGELLRRMPQTGNYGEGPRGAILGSYTVPGAGANDDSEFVVHSEFKGSPKKRLHLGLGFPDAGYPVTGIFRSHAITPDDARSFADQIDDEHRDGLHAFLDQHFPRPAEVAPEPEQYADDPQDAPAPKPDPVADRIAQLKRWAEMWRQRGGPTDHFDAEVRKLQGGQGDQPTQNSRAFAALYAMADVRPFADEMRKLPADWDRWQGADVHGVLSDYLMDRGDPRADLSTSRDTWQDVMRAHEAAGYRDADAVMEGRQAHPRWYHANPDDPAHYPGRREHAFPDGSALQVRPWVHPETGHTRLHVAWANIPGASNFYHRSMTEPEFDAWADSFPDDERERLHQSFPRPTPQQYARDTAPTPYAGEFEALRDAHRRAFDARDESGQNYDHTHRLVMADWLDEQGRPDEAALARQVHAPIGFTADGRVGPGHSADLSDAARGYAFAVFDTDNEIGGGLGDHPFHPDALASIHHAVNDFLPHGAHIPEFDKWGYRNGHELYRARYFTHPRDNYFGMWGHDESPHLTRAARRMGRHAFNVGPDGMIHSSHDAPEPPPEPQQYGRTDYAGEFEALRRAVRAEPGEHLHRHALADWLMEQGRDAEAAFAADTQYPVGFTADGRVGPGHFRRTDPDVRGYAQAVLDDSPAFRHRGPFTFSADTIASIHHAMGDHRKTVGGDMLGVLPGNSVGPDLFRRRNGQGRRHASQMTPGTPIHAHATAAEAAGPHYFHEGAGGVIHSSHDAPPDSVQETPPPADNYGMDTAPTNYDDDQDFETFANHVRANQDDVGARNAFSDWLRDRGRDDEADTITRSHTYLAGPRPLGFHNGQVGPGHVLDLDPWQRSYLDAALDTETDDDGNALSEYHHAGTIHPDTIAAIHHTTNEFRQRAGHALSSSDDPNDFGPFHFLTTRNGHGTGFWAHPEYWGDGLGMPDYATELTDHAKAMGEHHFYVGDDGMVHSHMDRPTGYSAQNNLVYAAAVGDNTPVVYANPGDDPMQAEVEDLQAAAQAHAEQYGIRHGVGVAPSQGDGWKLTTPHGHIDYRPTDDGNEIWWVESHKKGHGAQLVDMMQALHPADTIHWGVTTPDGKGLRDKWHAAHPDVQQANGAMDGQFDPSGDNYGEDDGGDDDFDDEDDFDDDQD